YALPDKRKEYLPRIPQKVTRRIDGTIEFSGMKYRDGRRGEFYLGDNGAFSFPVPFNDGEGIYTVVVWVSKAGVDHAIAASNISIQVKQLSAVSSQLSGGGRN